MDSKQDNAVRFRPLAEADLPMLWQWLQMPHVQRFYQREPLSWDEAVGKYTPRIRGQEPVQCSLALHEETPIGYLQCYRNADFPAWAETLETSEGFSLDLFLGPPERLGRGWGRRMLGAYTATGGPFFICHEAANGAAIACSRAAGFSDVRWLWAEDEPCLLLRRRGS